MKTLLAVGVSGIFALLAVAQDEGAVKKEMELFKGTWKFESVEGEGGKKEDLGDATLTFSNDGKVEFKKGNDAKKATYKINPAGKPKEIDLKPDDKDESMQGIYRLEKDTLVICIVEGANAARPTEFAAQGRNMLVTLKRLKE
jgi:uncharacterized protein (TIGR03067 family)